jgi:hypothetical protein
MKNTLLGDGRENTQSRPPCTLRQQECPSRGNGSKRTSAADKLPESDRPRPRSQPQARTLINGTNEAVACNAPACNAVYNSAATVSRHIFTGERNRMPEGVHEFRRRRVTSLFKIFQ